MPALEDLELEMFASLLADGVSKPQAYLKAGLNRPNLSQGQSAIQNRASGLSKKPLVMGRMLELRAERTDLAAKAVDVDREWVMTELHDNLNIAKTERPILDRKGNPTGKTQIDIPSANAVLKLMGTEVGMFNQTVMHEHLDHRLDSMSPEELREILVGLLPDVGLRMVTMSEEEIRDYCIAVGPSVGLRVEPRDPAQRNQKARGPAPPQVTALLPVSETG